MKIICVGRNYSEHAKELNNAVPDKPVIFLKPDTAVLKENKPFYLPEWSNDVHHEAEIVYKVSKNGKYIDEAHASKYVSEVTLGIDFTARDIQNELKAKGLPWEISKGFDNSAVLGTFMKLEELQDANNISFHLEKNGQTVQTGHTSEMIFSLPKIIAFVSQYFTLKHGDLIFTGTPAGVGKVAIDDELKGFVEQKEVFSFKVK
jgi:2-keto-4-pentenoate hydratase/2-oxohepta-3-ene-1,7-dioic acid hydratase in catechol pathway